MRFVVWCDGGADVVCDGFGVLFVGPVLRYWVFWVLDLDIIAERRACDGLTLGAAYAALNILLVFEWI